MIFPFIVLFFATYYTKRNQVFFLLMDMFYHEFPTGQIDTNRKKEKETTKNNDKINLCFVLQIILEKKIVSQQDSNNTVFTKMTYTY